MFRNLLLAAVITLSGTCVFAQQLKMSALPISRSEFVDKIKALKKVNPQINAEQFAEAANASVDKDGLPFGVLFDPATCGRLRKAKD